MYHEQLPLQYPGFRSQVSILIHSSRGGVELLVQCVQLEDIEREPRQASCRTRHRLHAELSNPMCEILQRASESCIYGGHVVPEAVAQVGQVSVCITVEQGMNGVFDILRTKPEQPPFRRDLPASDRPPSTDVKEGVFPREHERQGLAMMRRGDVEVRTILRSGPVHIPVSVHFDAPAQKSEVAIRVDLSGNLILEGPLDVRNVRIYPVGGSEGGNVDMNGRGQACQTVLDVPHPPLPATDIERGGVTKRRRRRTRWKSPPGAA